MKVVNYLIYTSDLENSIFIKKAKSIIKNSISAVDTRSAVYMATGICAQNNDAVMVCVNSGNSSRSAFSGMTEAFYRQLPVILVTLGQELDYSKELNDVIYSHTVVLEEENFDFSIPDKKLPMHIELLSDVEKTTKTECDSIQQILSQNLNINDYLYMSQGIWKRDFSYKCKVVQGGMPDCADGAVANVLGASLAHVRKRYIGLITEDECIHDINSLGNIHVNSSLLYIVVCKTVNEKIYSYASTLGFYCKILMENNIKEDEICKIVNCPTKIMILLCKE